MKLNRGNLLLTLLLFSILLSGCATQVPLKAPPFHPIETKHLHRTSSYPVKQLTCKPLMLSEIELPADETILSLNAGDTVRWLFQTIVSDTDSEPITHILVKPKENNLQTNLFIATNQGLHRINLMSNDEANTSPALKLRETINPVTTSCKKIDTHYTMKVPFFETPPVWLPRSIYNDGKSVFIQMPNLQQGAAPNFYVIDENGQRAVVNYQVDNDTYRIDQLFTDGILLQGIGRKQQKVFINYIGNGN